MPKISFHEFRPGKWVKLVDGKVVGPATAAEVATWKQEKAAPVHIWEDVVATASRPPLGEVKVATSPAVKAGAPAQPGTPKERDQSTLWEDLVKRSQPSVQAEGPPKPHPRKDDTDWAEQAQIWQDVVNRAKKPASQPGRQPAQGAPTSSTTASEAKLEPAPTASLVPVAAPALAALTTPPAEPKGEGPGPQKAFAAQMATRELAAEAPKPSAEAKVEEEAAPVSKAPDTKPAPPAKLTTEAERTPSREAASALRALPAEMPPASKARVAKARPQRPAAKEKTKALTKAVPGRKTPPQSELSGPATRARLPAKLLDEIAEQASPSVTERGEAAKTPEAKRLAAPSSERESVSPRPRGSRSAVARRTAGKDKTVTPQERPHQLYLWISAGQADDLIAAVRTGLARYQERFSHVAEVVLCHSADLPTLEGARLPVDLREGKSLAPRNFWIGSK